MKRRRKESSDEDGRIKKKLKQTKNNQNNSSFWGSNNYIFNITESEPVPIKEVPVDTLKVEIYKELCFVEYDDFREKQLKVIPDSYYTLRESHNYNNGITSKHGYGFVYMTAMFKKEDLKIFIKSLKRKPLVIGTHRNTIWRYEEYRTIHNMLFSNSKLKANYKLLYQAVCAKVEKHKQIDIIKREDKELLQKLKRVNSMRSDYLAILVHIIRTDQKNK